MVQSELYAVTMAIERVIQNGIYVVVLEIDVYSVKWDVIGNPRQFVVSVFVRQVENSVCTRDDVNYRRYHHGYNLNSNEF